MSAPYRFPFSHDEIFGVNPVGNHPKNSFQIHPPLSPEEISPPNLV
jgi:hypothetical protein